MTNAKAVATNLTRDKAELYKQINWLQVQLQMSGTKVKNLEAAAENRIVKF